MNIAYKIALFCGLAPLVIAVIILTGWFITSAEEYLIAGIFNILGGVILFIIGCCCLIFYEYQSRQQHQQSAWKKLLKPFLIMVANFPAAALSIYSVFFVISLSSIQVINHSQEFIPSIELSSEYKEPKRITGVMPQSITKKYIRFKGGGRIDYTFELNGKITTGEFIPYASLERGNNIVMTIASNGQVTVDSRRKRSLL